MSELDNLKNSLQQALRELEETQRENAMLRERICALEVTMGSATSMPKFTEAPLDSTTSRVHARSTNAEKVALFLELFRGRDDVYATRWVGKDGKQGYSPACANDWLRGVCGKYQKVKCMECKNRVFMGYGENAIESHLRGEKVLGVYPLRPDDTCYFLAADFDGEDWRDDVAAFRESCEEFGVPVATERSRSGNGAHVWVFFSEPVPAYTARELGSRLLTAAMEKRHQIGLGSYDRLFPNQDTAPKGGFGNLIALPLQKEARSEGNTVFIDDDFRPYPDQWQFLSGVTRLRLQKVNGILNALSKEGNILGDLRSDEAGDEPPWRSVSKDRVLPLIHMPAVLDATISNKIYIDKTGLSQQVLNRIVRLAAFQNPEFYKAQAMRLPTFDKPRVICLAETYQKYVAIPRGCREQLERLCAEAGTQTVWRDETNPGVSIEVTFKGELRPVQQIAAAQLMEHDHGVLSATTAFGKTVVAAWLIARRKTNALVIVHRRQLLDQWKERLKTFLDLTEDAIGVIGGGKEREQA